MQPAAGRSDQCHRCNSSPNRSAGKSDTAEPLGLIDGCAVAIVPAKATSHSGKITLLPNLQPAEAFSTLVHEGGARTRSLDLRRAETTRTIRETEAEAVALVVCQAIGLQLTAAARPTFNSGMVTSRR